MERIAEGEGSVKNYPKLSKNLMEGKGLPRMERIAEGEGEGLVKNYPKLSKNLMEGKGLPRMERIAKGEDSPRINRTKLSQMCLD